MLIVRSKPRTAICDLYTKQSGTHKGAAFPSTIASSLDLLSQQIFGIWIARLDVKHSIACRHQHSPPHWGPQTTHRICAEEQPPHLLAMPPTRVPAESEHDATVGNNNRGRDNGEEMVPQSNPTNELLQLTQAASGSAIHIPADILTSLLLLHNLNSFQSSITELKAENGGLRRQLDIMDKNVLRLQVHAGMEFALFPKLPLEVRRIIWRFFANIPQVVGLKLFRTNFGQGGRGFVHQMDLIPTTGIRRGLVNVCRDARKEVSAMFLQLKRRKGPLPDDIQADYTTGFPIIFSNEIADKIWLTPAMAQAGYIHYNIVNVLINHCVLDNEGQPNSIPKLALPYECWYNRMGDGEQLSIMDTLRTLRTEEVILVVGDDSASTSPDIVFIQPRGTPRSMISRYMFDEENWGQDEVSWGIMNASIREHIKFFQENRTEERRLHLLGKSKAPHNRECCS
jgi:2EXR family